MLSALRYERVSVSGGGGCGGGGEGWEMRLEGYGLVEQIMVRPIDHDKGLDLRVVGSP